jgi:hypothetical protein
MNDANAPRKKRCSSPMQGPITDSSGATVCHTNAIQLSAGQNQNFAISLSQALGFNLANLFAKGHGSDLMLFTLSKPFID